MASDAGRRLKERPRPSLRKLDARTRTVFERYLDDIAQRGSGVVGWRSPNCTLFDFVQQRMRPFLAHGSLGCCEAAPLPRAASSLSSNPRGRCLAGARLLISVASYGNDPQNWAYLSLVLDSLDDARRSAGTARMDIALDLTAKPGKRLRVPDGLNVTHVLHDRSVRKDLAGKHRPRFSRALATGDYDYYAYFPNDLNVTAEALDALCAWQAPLAGTNMMVGLLRWEARKDGPSPRKLLNDQALCCPPHLGVPASCVLGCGSPPENMLSFGA